MAWGNAPNCADARPWSRADATDETRRWSAGPSPLAYRLSPLNSRLLTLASYLSPLASYLSPLAARLSRALVNMHGSESAVSRMTSGRVCVLARNDTPLMARAEQVRAA